MRLIVCILLVHRVLNNFMLWRLASSFLPFLSREFRVLSSSFRSQLSGAPSGEQRWLMCIETMKDFFDHPLAALYSRKYSTQEDKETVSFYFLL